MTIEFTSGENYIKVKPIDKDGEIEIEIYEDFQGTSCYFFLCPEQAIQMGEHLIQEAKSKQDEPRN